jgi:hypothetical protein
MGHPNAKLDSLTTLRFFAATMIVLAHAQNTFKCLGSVGKNIVLDHCVSFFFVLSGFILTLSF